MKDRVCNCIQNMYNKGTCKAWHWWPFVLPLPKPCRVQISISPSHNKHSCSHTPFEVVRTKPRSHWLNAVSQRCYEAIRLCHVISNRFWHAVDTHTHSCTSVHTRTHMRYTTHRQVCAYTSNLLNKYRCLNTDKAHTHKRGHTHTGKLTICSSYDSQCVCPWTCHSKR